MALNLEQLQSMGDGRYKVSGKLSFATVRALLLSSRSMFAVEPPQEIDLSGVTLGDSAGLALLVEWFRMSAHAGRSLRFSAASPQLQALSKISDLQQVLSL
jgi:phospholipid transport system transporter-binding protein